MNEERIVQEPQEDNITVNTDNPPEEENKTSLPLPKNSELWLGEEVRDIAVAVGAVGVAVGMGIAYLFSSRNK